jgi:hypothetical protein
MFQGWENVYYLMGPAAVGLIGLMFIGVTLTNNFNAEKAERGQRLFMTPTVMQLAITFLISALALAPKLSPEAHRWTMGAVGVWGLIYTTPSALKLTREREVVSHWSDMWFYGLLPVAIYLVLTLAITVWTLPQDVACRLTALSLLAILMLSVRNAWDLVTWIAPRRNKPETSA